MRLLTIFGNTIRKRLISAVLSLCPTIIWEDPFEWKDECRWKEPQCCSYLWDNQEIWNQNCPIKLDPEEECCSSDSWDDPKNWDDACDWPDGYTSPEESGIWEEELFWQEQNLWGNPLIWDESENWNNNDTWSQS